MGRLAIPEPVSVAKEMRHGPAGLGHVAISEGAERWGPRAPRGVEGELWKGNRVWVSSLVLVSWEAEQEAKAQVPLLC